MSKFLNLLIGTALISTLAAPAMAEKLGLGRAAMPEEVAAWDRDVSPDGTGLPEGSGDVLTGEELFSANCAACHGEFGEGVDNWPKLAGGKDTLADDDPLKTVGSFWPHLSTTFDYVQRSMPYGNAQSLSPDEVYSIVAYILYNNDLVDEDFVLSKENFTEVVLPNAGGFIVDDRETTELPIFTREPCMENCKETVEITAHATVLDVTPFDASAEPAAVEAAVADTAEMAPVAAVEPAAAEPAAAEPAAAEPAATEAAAEPAAAEAAPAAAVDPALAAAGEKVFKKCAACHKVGEGAKHAVGPVLNGIVGRAAGSAEGFKYSAAMTEAGAGGMVWDAATIDAYLADPKGFIPKNKMSFAGLKKPEDRAAVIAYLAGFAQ